MNFPEFTGHIQVISFHHESLGNLKSVLKIKKKLSMPKGKADLERDLIHLVAVFFVLPSRM